MNWPIGGSFIPDPSRGTLWEMLYEETSNGWKATREFFRALNAAPDMQAKLKLLQELKAEREAKQKGYTNGLVEITIDLTSTPVQVTFNLQQKLHDGAWPEWEKSLDTIKQGVISARPQDNHTVVLELGDFYRDQTRATIVAQSAAELVHLTTGNSGIRYKTDEG